jgi:hypothetical protein
MSQHVFARSTSGHLIHYWWVNFLGWQFEDLTATTGGTPITAPPQVTLGPGIGAGGIADINVFAQGSRGALIRYRRVEPGPWLADNLSAPAGSLAVRAHLVLLQGLERSASGIDALHVASKGTTQPVIYDWLDGMPWSSHLVN